MKTVPSEQNVEIVGRWFEGMGRGELGSDQWDPELRIDNTHDFPITGPYLGREGLRQWWGDLGEVIDDITLEPEEIVALDDQRVLTVQRLLGRFAKTGIEVDARWASIVTVRDDRIASAIGYPTRKQAMRAADAAN